MRRLAWVDTARGVAICLVALFHATNWLMTAGFHVDAWVDINVVLSSIRMPVFFAIAGMFALKWIDGSWSSLLRAKVMLFVWVYLVWEVVGSVVGWAGMGLNGDRTSLLRVVHDLILSPIVPRFELWFIWALAIFFVIAKLTRRVHPRAQLLLAAMISVVALSGWEAPNVGWGGALKYYFFFLIGLYLKDWIMAFSRVRSRAALAAIVLTWAALGTLLVTFDLQAVPGLYFLNCVLGLLAGVCIGRALSGLLILGHLGSRTLPIYLGHTPIIVTCVLVFSTTGLIPSVPDAVAVILPAILAPVAMCLAYVLYRGLDRRLPWLYEPPAALIDLVLPTRDQSGRRRTHQGRWSKRRMDAL
ncbi:MAG: acyltransferase family protein [Kineosporiaceae bacterium]|nr:acyltransferase family protein [Aeromicrobium sp.]